MNILEKEIEDLLFYALTELSDDEVKARRVPKLDFMEYKRQVDLKEYGIADVIGYCIDEAERECMFQVFELKKEKIGVETLLQAVRYARALQLLYDGYTVRIELVLVGKSINKVSDFCYIASVFRTVTLLTYHIDVLNGLSFEKHYGFSLISSPNFDKLIESKSTFTNTKEAENG